MIKKVKLLLLALVAITSVNAAEWGDAQWIWQEQDTTPNTWVSFRKTVSLEAIPNEVEAHISVDSKFWLWVNGEMVLFEGGLSRGPSQAGEWDRKKGITPTNSWYETV